MDNTRKKAIHWRFYLAYSICALLVYVMLMAFVLPWWYASNHPVVVTIGAGSAQKMELAYSGNEKPLQLVPVGTPEGYHWEWATELPPRPNYDLELVFPEGTVGEVVFRQLELIQLSPARESRFLRANDMPEVESPGIQVKKLVDGVRIYAESGSRLKLELETVPPSAYTWLKTWAKASFGYLVTVVILLFVVASFVQFPDRIQAYRRKTPPLELALLVVCAVIGALVHMHLLNHSMPVFNPGESDPYVTQAIRLHDGQGLEGGEESDAINRPGYAYFLSMVAGRADWDLHSVVMAQGVLFCIALALAGLATTRLIYAWLLGPILILAMISPPAIWASRHIGVESLVATLWLLGLAAFLYQWKSEKWNKWLGFILFGIAASLGTCVSVTGLLMFVLPAGLLAGTFVWCIAIRGILFWRLDVFWRTTAQVLIPVAMLVTVSFFVSATQPSRWNLFSLSSDRSSASISCGMFEVRALGEDAQYRAAINERVRGDYGSEWASLTGDQQAITRSAQLLPMRAKFVAWGRLAFWGLFLPDVESPTGMQLRKDYSVANSFANPAEAKGVQDSIAGIMRETGRAVFVQEKRSNRQVVVYNQVFIGIYRWFYRVLFFVALAGWLIGLADRKHLAGLFIMPYMLNILLLVFTLNLGSEGIQSMDALLWMGALAGMLGASPKALQKPTDETDRRAIRPIRPKRLFTRQDTIPGVTKNHPNA